jgi:hypothetical protein
VLGAADFQPLPGRDDVHNEAGAPREDADHDLSGCNKLADGADREVVQGDALSEAPMVFVHRGLSFCTVSRIASPKRRVYSCPRPSPCRHSSHSLDRMRRGRRCQ